MFSLPEKGSSDVLNANASNPLYPPPMLLGGKAEPEALKSKFFHIIDIPPCFVHLCKFHCIAVGVEALCILVLLPSSKVTFKTITFKTNLS